MSSNNILVTGGTGYVGRELVRQLLGSADVSVHILDNLASGEHRLAAMDLSRLTLHRADLRDASAVARAVQQINPATIIHLAAVHFIPACEAAPGDAVSINVAGTVNLLAAARPSTRFVFASSAAVYAPSDSPHVESGGVGPVDIYGITKLHGERFVEYYHRLGRVNAAIVRLFNVTGPGETNPHLVPAVIGQITRGELRVQLGNLFPRRDYIDVSDAAEGFRRIAAALADYTLPAPLISNLGTGTSHAVCDVVAQIGFAAGVELEIVQDEARVRSNDRPNLCASTAGLRLATGWAPSMTLSQSLTKAWQSRAADGLL